MDQIQLYDNLIGPVVDCFRFLTHLSYDVLLHSVIEILSNPNSENSKHEGTNISLWFLSLATFCGLIVKRYSIELPGLLQFIANKLKVGKSLDLLILKEVVQKMTGIEFTEEMTNEQLEALSGGELLRSEGGSYNQIRNIKKSTYKLKDALMETNLAMPLCILIAQQRNCILYQSANTHLKLIGKLYDQCQETLVQYGNFLANTLTINDYKRRLPPLKQLIVDCDLSPDVTFFLYRPMISHDIESAYQELVNDSKANSNLLECYALASEKVISPIYESVQSTLSTKDWFDLNPLLFVNFWTLTMYDLQVPEHSYAREKEKIDQQIQMVEDNKDIPPNKMRKERDRFLSIKAKLNAELEQQRAHCERVRYRLDKDKHLWFGASINKMDLTTKFLQHCLFPRCKFTASDALYCAKFIHMLHSLKTPNFSTLICFDRV